MRCLFHFKSNEVILLGKDASTVQDNVAPNRNDPVEAIDYGFELSAIVTVVFDICLVSEKTCLVGGPLEGNRQTAA
ncbi:hypothetical protein H4S14_003782 [Agrobacterium vitis]|nr:hypothetical protein [Agrobacterium vitis]MBE1440013.1 hypothetical protein [Agrobacterium vitis]